MVADPAGPRAGEAKFSTVGILTPIEHCATITFGPRFGTVRDPLVRFVAVKSGRSSSAEELISSRVEEIHKTSREPNGRTREEGSDDRGNPAVAPERTLARRSSPRARELVSRDNMA